MDRKNTVRYPFTKQIMFAKVMEDPEKSFADGEFQKQLLEEFGI